MEEKKGGPDSRESFRMYDDGQFKGKVPFSSHPNILKAVIIGKKSWGLWVKQWTDGIVDWCFTKDEILSQFEENGIKIPEPFLRDFENVLEKKRQKRNTEYAEKFLRERN